MVSHAIYQSTILQSQSPRDSNLTLSCVRLYPIHFPSVTLASCGFSVSAGITHDVPILYAPTMRPDLHNSETRREVTPHSFPAWSVVIMSIVFAPSGY